VKFLMLPARKLNLLPIDESTVLRLPKLLPLKAAPITDAVDAVLVTKGRLNAGDVEDLLENLSLKAKHPQVYNFVFKTDMDLKFNPGDSIGVMPRNPVQIVDAMLERLSPGQAAKESASHLHELLFQADLVTMPRKPFFLFLSQHTSNDLERTNLLHLTQATNYNHLRVQMPHILDILATFPSCSPPLDILLSNLPKLTPRFYSVTNSPITDPLAISITLDIVSFTHDHGTYEGICSNYLYSLEVDTHIPIFLRPGNNFTLCPGTILMIATGTGVTPFMSFLEHMKLNGDKRDCVLIHGHRNKLDALYGDFLRSYVDCGVLGSFVECTSRSESAEFKYVYEAVRIDKRVRELVKLKATVYVCG
jgi:sulfite reductase alpha subunit-like flavoprotein